ncbi:MAG: hypothetical protein HDR23_10170 [Lachnospiraceae bacterium]|nr:hypothetical protein [Lachnospiraceae bacterium]
MNEFDIKNGGCKNLMEMTVSHLKSYLRRNYHMDKLPRGRLQDKLLFGLKVGALNVRKLFTYRKGLGNYAPNPIIL